MKERPILFKGEMVRAILEGRKTQTRRVVKPQPERSGDAVLMWGASRRNMRFGVQGMDVPPGVFARCPYGVPGDRLWVREKFQKLFADGVENHWETDWKTGKGYSVSYPATDGIHEFVDPDDNIRDACKPSIHMPRWASRITLKITGVRVERLQDISEADSVAEGVEGFDLYGKRFWINYLLDQEERAMAPSFTHAYNSYRSLWESINGPGSWDQNPWVWVIEFKQVQP